MRQIMDMDRPMYDTTESALGFICSNNKRWKVAAYVHVPYLDSPDIHQNSKTGEMGTGALDSGLVSTDCCLLCSHILYWPTTVCQTDGKNNHGKMGRERNMWLQVLGISIAGVALYLFESLPKSQNAHRTTSSSKMSLWRVWDNTFVVHKDVHCMILTMGTAGNWNSIATACSSDSLFVVIFSPSTAIWVEIIRDTGSPPTLYESDIGPVYNYHRIYTAAQTRLMQYEEEMFEGWQRVHWLLPLTLSLDLH